MMYNQGLDMSPDDIMGTRLDRLSEGRNASSGSKRNEKGQTTEAVEIIRNAMEYANDKLQAIVEWPNVHRQAKDASHVEVVKQLQGILELSICDRVVRLMQIIMRNVHNMKAFLEILDELKLDQCTTILEDNA